MQKESCSDGCVKEWQKAIEVILDVDAIIMRGV